MKVHSDKNTKTEKQWLKMGRIPIDENMGELLWANCYCQYQCKFYSFEETREATEEEIKAVKEPYLIKKREYQKKYRERKKEEKERVLREQEEEQEYEKQLDFRKEEIKKAWELPVVKCENKSKIVVIDLETTGLNIDGYLNFETNKFVKSDEILQIGIIDGNGNVLMNTYVKPYYTQSWSESQAIHNITPQMVENAPYLHELIPELRGIFEDINVIVGYNLDFDIGFLEMNTNIQFKNVYWFDVADEYARRYNYDCEKDRYSYVKLTKCADFFGYQFKAYDALEGAKATLHCYNKLQQFIIKQGKVRKI